MIYQRTLQNSIRATGVGVHTGDKVFITLRPAPANTGIVFCRTDLDTPVDIKAVASNVGDTTLSTCLAKDNVRIATVEHLLSAMAGLGIDNAYVDINSPELPIMDGSAGPFVFLIQSAGIVEQEAPKKFIRIKRKVTIEEGEKRVALEPHNGFVVNFSIEYDHPVFDKNNQNVSFDFSMHSYVKDIARARTYGFLSDYEYIRKNNLARGASLDNAVVIDEFKVMNQDGLRYIDECVRHKILDVVGDLYLLGYSMIGSFAGHKSGHALNNRLLLKLLADEKAYDIVTFEDPDQVPVRFLQPLTES